ncbi:hypothetical protein C0J52_07222 [Blattella germanica]|nr:hypothetical protein C0J52_07222 [Blattella germanica]
MNYNSIYLAITELPPIGFGFFAHIIHNLHERYISNRNFNNETLQKFNKIWTDNFQKVTDEIKDLGKELKNNSQEGFAAKAIKVATQTAALTTSGLKLIGEINGVLMDIATRFGGLVPLFTEFFFRNLANGQEAAIYTYQTIYTRVRKIADEIFELIRQIRNRLDALVDQLRIFLLTLTVEIAAAIIPIRQRVIAIATVVQVGVLRMKIILTRIQLQIQQIVVGLQKIVVGGVNRFRQATAPIRTVIGNIVTSVRNHIRGFGQGIRNMFRGILNRFLHPTKPSAPVTTPAPLPSNSTVNETTTPETIVTTAKQ